MSASMYVCMYVCIELFLKNNCLSDQVLTIRIITMDRPDPLRRLLTSMLSAKYDSDPVNVEFYVDHPKDISSSSNQGTSIPTWLYIYTHSYIHSYSPTMLIGKTALYMAVVGIVNGFKWKQGSVARHFEEQNAGIFKMWVRKFPMDEPDTSDRKHIMMVGPSFYCTLFYTYIHIHEYTQHTCMNIHA